MKNKWNNSEARKYINYYKKYKISKELALRIYTTHLLGREKSLVLHGGGNTSLKTSIQNIFKEEINVMHIKGSGWDMGTIDHPGLPAVELKPLLETNKLKKQKILRFPGDYNPLTAKLIAEIGFDGVYISGGVMSNDLGIPDIGLTTLKEVSYRANQISRVTDLPAIVDADTGFNDCKKTIETFEKLCLS